MKRYWPLMAGALILAFAALRIGRQAVVSAASNKHGAAAKARPPEIPAPPPPEIVAKAADRTRVATLVNQAVQATVKKDERTRAALVDALKMEKETATLILNEMLCKAESEAERRILTDLSHEVAP